MALQVGMAAPATAVQVCGVPSAVLPFMNCTVPVGLAPVPVPVTVAVKVVLPPEAILVGEAVSAVEVATVPVVDVTVTVAFPAPDEDELV